MPPFLPVYFPQRIVGTVVQVWRVTAVSGAPQSQTLNASDSDQLN